MSMNLILDSGSSKYGAQMGRRNVLPADVNAPIKLRMEKLRWVDGDYDQFGAYWGGGSGDNVYCAHTPANRVFVRSNSRANAKEKVRAILSKARFFV